MSNFFEHYEREGEVSAAALSWLRSLEEAGIFVKTTEIPNLFHFGQNHDVISHVASRYGNPQDLITEARIKKYSVSHQPLLELCTSEDVRVLCGKHLDHNQTLERMRNQGLVRAKSPFGEVLQYVGQLNKSNVNLQKGSWEEILGEENHVALAPFMANPFSELELYAATGRAILRCKPGWSDTHDGRAVYRLGGIWEDNTLLRKMTEEYHRQGKFKFTDSCCNECYEIQMRKALE